MSGRKPAKRTQEALKQTSIALPMGLWERAKILGVKKHMDLRAIMAEALEAYLKKQGA